MFLIIIALSFSFSTAISYVCTYQHKDYYGEDSIGFQFPQYVFPVKQDLCSTDCKPYEQMTLNGTEVWLGYQSLCSFHPYLEEYDLNEEPEDIVYPLSPYLSPYLSLEEGVYLSYPSTTICLSNKPCN